MFDKSSWIEQDENKRFRCAPDPYTGVVGGKHPDYPKVPTNTLFKFIYRFKHKNVLWD